MVTSLLFADWRQTFDGLCGLTPKPSGGLTLGRRKKPVMWPGRSSAVLLAIHNQHYIYETLVRVVENAGLITKREIDPYANPQAAGC